MPSVRMKNSSMGCLRGKNGLHVCQKSHMMSKRSCSQVTISQLAAEYGTCAQDCNDSNSVKISQLAAEYGACTQNSNYISSTNEVIAQDVERVDSTDGIELPSREDTHLKKQPPSLDNHAAHHRMETTLVSCCTNLETIFSPTVQKVTANGPDIDKDEGSNNDSDIFQSRAADESDGNSGSSSDHQTCNLSDFYISDMFLSGFPFDTSSLCNDIAETNPLPEYGAAESSLFLDATEQRMTLPHLHDSAESNDMQNTGPCDETKVHGDDSSFFLAIHQMSPRDQVHNCSPYPDSEEAESFDPHSFIRNLPELSDIPPNTQPTLLPRASGERARITLVLDLDETLVHSSLDYCEDANFTFTVFFNLKEHTVYVKERPHLRTFLKRVAEMFEVVIFTASQSIYAKQLLDILDPDGKLISQRQYRESCIFSDGTYTKDLTVLGVDLAKVVIIDNCPQVFRLQVNNGIPIKSWFDDPSDNELISLIPFLETLVDVDDVRPIVAKRFGNKE